MLRFHSMVESAITYVCVCVCACKWAFDRVTEQRTPRALHQYHAITVRETHKFTHAESCASSFSSTTWEIDLKSSKSEESTSA
jgi:hypothetical protein